MERGGTRDQVRGQRSEGRSLQRRISLDVPSQQSPFPTFTQPKRIGCFSLDAKRQYIDGPQYLKYLQLPPSLQHVTFDLDRLNGPPQPGHAEDAEEMHQQTNELVHILHWIHEHVHEVTQRKPHFVFYRGLMTKILGTPYEDRECWRVGAMLRKGTIYLRNIDTPESIKDRQRQENDPRSRRMSSWGYNFEHFLLSETPWSQPSPHASKEKNECNFVFQGKLGEHDLLYAAEIDGVWLPSPAEADPKVDLDLLRNCDLVELKTTRAFPHGDMTRNFRKFNLRKWFCQSYTVGISHVVAGLRDDDGVVNELQLFPVKKLSDLRLEWSSNVCFKFLESFLTTVKEVVGGDETKVFLFYFDPSASSRASKCFRVDVEDASTSQFYLPNVL